MKIIIPVHVYQKMRAYVEALPYEISGLGKIRKEKDVITVEDVQIFQQKVAVGETIIDHNALAKFYDDKMKQNEDMSKWKLWWHSHAKMPVFFSGTDLDTINDFDNETFQENWVLSIVTNHKADLKARLDIYYPIRCSLPNLVWEISYENSDIEMDIASEIKEKVTTFSYIPPKKTEIDFAAKRNIATALRLLLKPDGTPRFPELNIKELLSGHEPHIINGEEL